MNVTFIINGITVLTTILVTTIGTFGTSWSIETSNRKVLGSAPDRSTIILGENKVNELTQSFAKLIFSIHQLTVVFVFSSQRK